MKPNDSAIRKRTQITKANRTMFIWITVASALIGAAAVVSIFLFQQLVYTEKVLAEKQKTASVLENNISNVADLEDEIRALDTNTALTNLKANENDQAIQVILDALPSEVNSLAFGASLQSNLLVGIPNMSVESMQVDPVNGVEKLSTTTTTSKRTTNTANEITFRFTILATTQDAIKATLDRLERSIRTIEVISVRVEVQASGPQMVVEGRAFFEPEKTVELESKEVPR